MLHRLRHRFVGGIATVGMDLAVQAILHAGEHSGSSGPEPLLVALAVAAGVVVTTAAFYWLRVRS